MVDSSGRMIAHTVVSGGTARIVLPSRTLTGLDRRDTPQHVFLRCFGLDLVVHRSLPSQNTGSLDSGGSAGVPFSDAARTLRFTSESRKVTASHQPIR